MPATRVPWGNFPNVLVHTNVAALEKHPAYAAATKGDLRAARVVVADLFKPHVVTVRADFVAPVIKFDVNEHWNALPLAFAYRLAVHAGARVLPTIVQTNVIHRSGANSIYQLLDQPTLAGKVPSGTYLIVDDVVSLGSTLANLRGHIETHGGRVIAASTLSAAIFATKMAPDLPLISSLKRRFGHELSLIPEKLGFPPECLTSKEAHFVNGLANLVSFRNPLAPTHCVISPAL